MWARHWRVAVAAPTGQLDSLLAGHLTDQVLHLGFAGRILPTIRKDVSWPRGCSTRPPSGRREGWRVSTQPSESGDLPLRIN